MRRPLTKREVDILEQRGLWEAHSYLRRITKRLFRKRLPVEFRYIRQAHQTAFTVAHQPEIAGKYRRDNDLELRRIDGTPLPIADWREIPSKLAELDYELRAGTESLQTPKTEKDYERIIGLAAKLSHRLASIHPFKNGNGRASRLLIDAILMRAGLSSVAIKEEKAKYLRAMRQADDGDFSRLEEMIINSLAESKEKNYRAALRKQAELQRAKRHRKSRVR
jgi:Fic family protein